MYTFCIEVTKILLPVSHRLWRVAVETRPGRAPIGMYFWMPFSMFHIKTTLIDPGAVRALFATPKRREIRHGHV